ncbi:MAG TPA: tellurite resistance/C4-dicarboxylate transporter family protein [Candidatus Dietzia intestinigallinarum]|nr:tellurite resistance/C4-dicarboxylate transporter family protein [Candidatus Dietzia intestinigallinarum]
MTGAQPTRRREGAWPTPAHMSPGYFAVVMGTGIITIGAGQRGWHTLADLLLILTAGEYAVLVLLSLWRVGGYRDLVVVDLKNPRVSFQFFTFVAGTNVLAAALAAHGHLTAATVLLCVGVVAVTVLGYVIPWLVLLARGPRSVLPDVNGTWFLWAVALHSVAIGAAILEHHATAGTDVLAAVAVISWSVGVGLYVATAVLVMMRLVLLPVEPEDIDPPFWILMGLSALVVVAGSHIVEMADTPLVDDVRGLVAGLLVLFWGVAAWLLPVMVALGVWRHGFRRVPLRYTPALWSIVFPLGMFAASGMTLGGTDRVPLATWLGRELMWVALGVWALTYLAMVWSGVRRLREVRSPFIRSPR